MEAAQSNSEEGLIFVCDDDNDIAEVTRLILNNNHHQVKVFSVCEEIVESAKKYKPGLILLDLWMPEMGGEKVAKLLKSDPETRYIPVYLFSATRNLPAVVERTGADGYLNKPFDIEELEALVQKALTVRRRTASR